MIMNIIMIMIMIIITIIIIYHEPRSRTTRATNRPTTARSRADLVKQREFTKGGLVKGV